MSVLEAGAVTGLAAAEAPLVSLRDVHLSFGSNHVLKGIDLDVHRGQAVSIIGPSGSGKSTILRLITGLIEPQKGEIFAVGRRLADLRTEPQKNTLRREVGFVFQQYNLFPHLTVLDNLTIAPVRVLGQDRKSAENTARDLLAKVRLAEKIHAFPGELSGGQQQRVAIARALAMQPQLILFDEVTSALDPETVGEVLTVIRDLVREGLTCLLVTHEMSFAEEISNDVYFIDGGRIVEHGPTAQIFRNPRSERTRAFLARARNQAPDFVPDEPIPAPEALSPSLPPTPVDAKPSPLRHDAPSARGHLSSRLLHAGSPAFDPHTQTAPVNVPVVRTSTILYESFEARSTVQARRSSGERLSAYGRHGSETHRALEDAFNELEGSARTFLLPSGLGAVSLSLLSLLSPGDHALVTDSVYTPLRHFDRRVLKRLGIELSYIPATAHLNDHIRPNTRLLYTESPGSLLMEVVDLPRLVAEAHARNLLVVADNTWGSGYLYHPLELGADVSVIAGTKYISGHSDVMLGAVSVADPEIAHRIAETYEPLGLAIGADDAYLALRGVRTLPVRIAQSGKNALEIAQFLETHPAVSRVYYPALTSDPGHDIWQRDFSGANGLLSFQFANATPESAIAFVNALQWFGIGASWGGFESLALVVDPARLAEHSYWNGDERPVVRLHVGLEDPGDLIADLGQAFETIGAATSESPFGDMAKAIG